MAEKNERKKGSVKWYNQVKEYGFITGEDNEDYFVHKSQLPEGETLKENEKVSFTESKDEKGRRQAKDVKKEEQ